MNPFDAAELFFDMTLIFSLQNMFTLPLTTTGLCQLAFFYILLFNAWLGIAFFNTRCYDANCTYCLLSLLLVHLLYNQEYLRYVR